MDDWQPLQGISPIGRLSWHFGHFQLEILYYLEANDLPNTLSVCQSFDCRLIPWGGLRVTLFSITHNTPGYDFSSPCAYLWISLQIFTTMWHGNRSTTSLNPSTEISLSAGSFPTDQVLRYAGSWTSFLSLENETMQMLLKIYRCAVLVTPGQQFSRVSRYRGRASAEASMYVPNIFDCPELFD
jgi:hypothetical protein